MPDERQRLIARVSGDLLTSGHAIALTGAGISTESGIPDFRGPSGIWTQHPEAEKAAYRSYEKFVSDPKGWWQARLAQPGGILRNLGTAQPNPGHIALAELEKMGILKWVITQNIDGLHEKAGTRNLLEYHGNAFKLRCVDCGARFGPGAFDFEKLQRDDRLPPTCPGCRGLVKSDTVSFGEPIPSTVAARSYEEALKCDLMLICGTSAVVYPFAELPRVARGRGYTRQPIDRRTESRATGIIIVEINAEPTPLTHGGISDYLIQGKTGEILPLIVEEATRLR